MARRTVVVLGFDGIQGLDVLGPIEVFAGATRALALTAKGTSASRGYDVTLAAATPEITTESGVTLRCASAAAPAPPSRRIDTLLLPGGAGVQAARKDAEFVDLVAAMARRSRRIATVCTGTFLAAEAGLLRGRTVTTHWAFADQLASEFPELTVDADPIYTIDGNVVTSAGVTAGIDLALALVANDHGPELAQLVARWLVMFTHRPGGQSQFATAVWTRRAGSPPVRHAQQAIDDDPGGDHTVERLAANAALSPRHFTRVFTHEVGETPAKYVERVRVELARHRLETTADGLDTVAADCGFGTAETLRRSFHRRLGVSPDQYRQRFRTT